MKYPKNIQVIQQSKPDFMGFIFYEKSPRYVEEKLSATILNKSDCKRVGVFVNSSVKEIKTLVEKYDLDYVQLHGDESLNFVKELYKTDIKIIKAIRVHTAFDWSSIRPFTSFVDYFLFDTQGKSYGGNGYKFDWKVLRNYKETKPFILSGGIGPEDVEKIKTLEIPQLEAIDINSKFEIEPGIKNEELVSTMINKLKNETDLSSK